jgi:O-antigen/teichoic acid export membrane protein
MNQVQRIAKNTLYLFIGNLSANIILFLINVYIARYLGSEIFGRYSSVSAYLAIFNVIAIFGIDGILTREISRNPSKMEQYINNGLIMKTAFSAIAIAIALLSVFFLPYDPSVKLGIAVGSASIIFASYALTFTTIYQVRLEMIFPAIANIVSKILFGILIVILLKSGGGFVKVIIASSVAIIVQAIILYRFSTKRVKYNFRFDVSVCKFILKLAWPMAVMDILIIIYNRMNIVLLSLYKGTQEVGFYSAAYVLTEAITIFSIVFMTSMFPIMSSTFKKDKKSFVDIYRKSFKYVLILAMPISIGGFMLREPLIALIYGSGYSGTVSAMAYLVWDGGFMLLNVVLANVVTAIDKQKANMAITASLVILHLALAMLLIPSMGFVGASIARLISEPTKMLVYLTFIYLQIRAVPANGFFKVVLGCLMMTLFLHFARFNVILEIIIASAIYFATILVVRALDANDISLVKRVLSGK